MDFYKRVGLVCGSIPCGKVASYGQIALLSGKPRNARQVGYALSHNMCGATVPAHRVVNGRGFLSGAGAFEYPNSQKKLLRAEGVKVSGENQVDLKKSGWKNTMEDAVFLSELFKQEGI